MSGILAEIPDAIRLLTGESDDYEGIRQDLDKISIGLPLLGSLLHAVFKMLYVYKKMVASSGG